MARRSFVARPLYFLALLLVAIFGAVGVGVGTSNPEDPNGASFTPQLALDLEGGTQLILTPKTDDGQAITDEDVNQAIAIIRQRVDGSGVAEAEITSQGGRNIVVGIPGEVDAATVELITASAQMRMRAVLQETGPGAIDPASLVPTTPEVSTDDETVTDGTETATDGTETATDGTATDDTSADGQVQADATPSTDATSTTEPTDAATTPAAPPTREEIEAAAMLAADADGDGVLNNEPLTEPTSSSDPAWITEQVWYDYWSLDCSLPENLAGGVDLELDQATVQCAQDGAAKYILGPAELTGADLDSAQMGYRTTSTGMSTNVPIVQMNFTGAGGDKFAAVTTRLASQAALGQNNQFAIVLDNLVISAPGVDEVIPDGRAEISGPSTSPFTRAQATTLANQLNFGSLPLTFEVQSQEEISATLGTEQLQKGMLAGLIGLVLVIGYSILQYRGLGLVTVASLFMAAAITYGIILLLSWGQGFRLSLPGVTGLIIAIGMTADSFIVYFERIRDEVREGRSLQAAVDHGWTRARRTILASDAVNLLAAVILYFLAVGGVRGFAFTLGLTTVVDVIVVMLFTHPMMKLLVRTKFFGGGHRLSGLDPVHLGANVAAYAGRGKTRSVPEREKIKAGADTRTIAERRAEQARLDAEAAAADSASDSTSTTDAASSDGFVDASVSSDSSEETR